MYPMIYIQQSLIANDIYLTDLMIAYIHQSQ